MEGLDGKFLDLTYGMISHSGCKCEVKCDSREQSDGHPFGNYEEGVGPDDRRRAKVLVPIFFEIIT